MSISAHFMRGCVVANGISHYNHVQEAKPNAMCEFWCQNCLRLRTVQHHLQHVPSSEAFCTWDPVQCGNQHSKGDPLTKPKRTLTLSQHHSEHFHAIWKRQRNFCIYGGPRHFGAARSFQFFLAKSDARRK